MLMLCFLSHCNIQVARYDEPDQGGHIQQGIYRLTSESWWTRFDPVFCCTRSTVAKEYNDALLRAEEVYVFFTESERMPL